MFSAHVVGVSDTHHAAARPASSALLRPIPAEPPSAGFVPTRCCSTTSTEGGRRRSRDLRPGAGGVGRSSADLRREKATGGGGGTGRLPPPPPPPADGDERRSVDGGGRSVGAAVARRPVCRPRRVQEGRAGPVPIPQLSPVPTPHRRVHGPSHPLLRPPAPRTISLITPQSIPGEDR